MRSSIKDLSHLKLDNNLSNLIYPRENDFLLTYPSLVKINVKNNKLRISSTGSTLWKQLVRVVIKLINLFNRGCDKLYKSFNVAIRICFNLPWNTHRYLIEELIDFPHPKIMLCSRFVNFHLSVKNSKKSSIRLLSHLSLLDDKTIYNIKITWCKLPGNAKLKQVN